ncbi:MAG: ammonia-forming cytochrome c nitrite reductase subunit c552 [Symbiobacteriia bacterium]
MFLLRKRALIALTALALVLLLAAAVSATPPIRDIQGHWAAADIQQAVSLGIVQVGDSGQFRPNDFLTGTDFAAWLTAAGKPTVGTAGSIDRVEAARILAAALGAETEARALAASDVSNLLSRFTDNSSIPTDLRSYAAVAVQKGWLEGSKKASSFQGVYTYSFEPGKSLTRAQGVSVLMRALGRATLTSKLSEYVGSKACLGCHTEKYVGWSESGHAHMLVPTSQTGAVPASEQGLTPEWKTMLQSAEYVVAGQRFLKRNVDGTHSYLPFVWNPAKQSFVASTSTANWEAGCAGCHTVGFNVITKKFADENIGCESCHGPGRDHILGQGDPTRIVSSTSSEVCGQCHTSGKMPNGTGWPVGFRPGMTVAETGYQFAKVDPTRPATSYSSHTRQYPFLVVTGHEGALPGLKTSGHASDRCLECHSADYRASVEAGSPITLAQAKESITCVVCHDPHEETGNPAQLRTSREAVCADCHNSEIPVGSTYKPGTTVHHPNREFLNGYGAIDIPNTLSVHYAQGVTCVDCHMVNGTHEFKAILPKDAKATGSSDSCDSCHTGSTPDIRQSYIDMWQNTVTAKLNALNPRIKADKAKVANIPALKLLVDKAATNLSMIEADGSKGAHNFEYAMKIINQVEAWLNEVEAKAK